VIQEQLEANNIPDLSNEELMAVHTEATDDEVLRTNVKPKGESQPVDVESKINDEQ
jgi:hypothetical protein